MISNVTKHKKTKKEEPKEVLKAEVVIEGMPDAVAIMNFDGTFSYINSEFERGSGWKRKEIIGKTSVELGIMSEEEAQKFEKEMVPKLMKQGFVRNIETTAVRRDGTKFPVLMSWVLTKNVKGEPIGIINIARDITKLKKTEQKLKEYSQNLEQKVKERTQELEEVKKG